MQERLSIAGYPSTALGWVFRLLVLSACYYWLLQLTDWDWLPTALLCISVWLMQFTTALWIERPALRLGGYSASWVLLWRAASEGLHLERPWYEVLTMSAFFASLMVWGEYQRRKTTEPA